MDSCHKQQKTALKHPVRAIRVSSIPYLPEATGSIAWPTSVKYPVTILGCHTPPIVQPYFRSVHRRSGASSTATTKKAEDRERKEKKINAIARRVGKSKITPHLVRGANTAPQPPTAHMPSTQTIPSIVVTKSQ